MSIPLNEEIAKAVSLIGDKTRASIKVLVETGT